MLTPNQILEKMEEVSRDFETARSILSQHLPLYEALHDECLLNIQAQRFDEFKNADNREALENAVISKLTKEEKAAFVRAENPQLADKVQRAQTVVKLLEKQFDMLNSMLIYHMHSNKQERAFVNHRT